MHYYPHHIADFNNATRHLGRLERSVYRDCIEMYYDTERPLDGTDMERLQRRLLCRSDEEKVALDVVLNEFFEEEDGVYMNGRCDREIAIYKNRDKDAAAKQDAANARKQRYRDDRRDMFAELRVVGVVPIFNIKMNELRALHAKHCKADSSNSKDDASGTSQERPEDASGTTKIEPLTINHEPVTNSIGFEQFWNAYDYKKGGVKKPQEKWLSLDYEQQQLIMAHVPDYVKSTPVKKFRKHPMTYLNNEGWLDEVDQLQPTNTQVASYANQQTKQSGSRSFDNMLDAQLAAEQGESHEYTVN